MIPVFLSADNNYAPFVATTMVSILANSKSFIYFYILDGGISDENKDKICTLKNKFNNFNIEFLKIDVDRVYDSLKCKIGVEHITVSAYNRFLIAKLKPELDKVIYLDVDIIVLGDIAELYNEPLNGYILGAIWNEKRKMFDLDSKELMEFPDDYKYFNSGVLLIDVKKWNQADVLSGLFELEKKYRAKILHGDETLLNKYFDGNYQVLDIKYDYLDYDVLNNPDIKPLIRHFATPMKPWTANYCWIKNQVIPLPNFDDFWRYAEMTPFYEKIRERYEQAINKTPFTKRMSQIADKMKQS